jgi:HSP20 family molecular chaperone IbpA
MTISAETNQSNDEKDDNGKYIRRERYSGTCSRSFYVGEDITEEDIKAKFDNGILKVFVPKKEAQPAVEENKYIAIEG